MKSDDFVQGIVPDWEWSGHGGNYDGNRGFITVHWDIQERDPDAIRLHVEAPRHATDNYLNGLKGRLVSLLLSSGIQRGIDAYGALVGTSAPVSAVRC